MKYKYDGKDDRAHKVPRDTLANIIKDVREKFKVPKLYKINERAIRSHESYAITCNIPR